MQAHMWGACVSSLLQPCIPPSPLATRAFRRRVTLTEAPQALPPPRLNARQAEGSTVPTPSLPYGIQSTPKGRYGRWCQGPVASPPPTRPCTRTPSLRCYGYNTASDHAVLARDNVNVNGVPLVSRRVKIMPLPPFPSAVDTIVH